MYLEGKITVKLIQGRRGPFAVGMLSLPFCNVEAKTPLLDALDPGTYTGRFDVQEIYLDYYRTGNGQCVSKMCARLADVVTDTDKPDRIETAVASDDATPASISAAPGASESAAPKDGNSTVDREPVDDVVKAGFIPDESTDAPADKADVDLFGEDLMAVIFARGIVTLDPAHDKFRAQVKRLKAPGSGYEFRGATRTWHPVVPVAVRGVDHEG